MAPQQGYFDHNSIEDRHRKGFSPSGARARAHPDSRTLHLLGLDGTKNSLIDHGPLDDRPILSAVVDAVRSCYIASDSIELLIALCQSN